METEFMKQKGQREIFLRSYSENGFCDKSYKSKQIPWMFYFSGITAFLLLVCTGMEVAWWTPVIPRILSNDTDLNPLGSPVTLGQISTLVALPSVGSPIGLLITGILLDTLGRKKCLIIAAMIIVCNQTAVAFAEHIYLFYIYNFIVGISTSITLVSVPVFTNEIAEDGNRGKLGCLLGLGVTGGMLLGYIYGPITSLRTSALIGAMPGLACLALSILIPDSPVFLALRGRKEDCIKALEKLKTIKDPKYIEAEYDKIETFAENKNVKKRSFFDIFKSRSPRRAFFLCAVIALVQQFSGILILLSFIGTIFQKSGSISAETFSIIVGIEQIIMLFIASNLVDRLGRRPLLLISLITSSIALFVLGLYFYFKHIDSFFLNSISWLPFLSIIIFVLGHGLGLGPIPISLIGELFPNDLRAMGCATIFTLNYAAFGTAMALFPIISSYWGVHYCIWFFSGSCFIGFLFMFFFLPETKSKSFLEIQIILEQNIFMYRKK